MQQREKLKKIAAITGITGQDGSILARQLLEKNYIVIGMKRRTSVFNTERIDDIYHNPNLIIEYFDLSDANSINRIVAKYKPDEYYNLAAQSHVKVSFDVPEDTVNGIIMGTLYALEAIKNINPDTKFYQASSSEQFGENPNYPYNEESRFMPTSPYAIAKVAAHNLVRNYRISYGIFACCGILFNHESIYRGETFVTRKIAKGVAKIKLGLQEFVELGNIDTYRDWGYAPEYTCAMWLMLQQDKPDDYVISTGEKHSVKEFLKEVFDYAELGNYEKFIKINPIYFRPQEAPCLVGSYDKAKLKLGWEPKIRFKELIKIMYDNDYKLLSEELGE